MSPNFLRCPIGFRTRSTAWPYAPQEPAIGAAFAAECCRLQESAAKYYAETRQPQAVLLRRDEMDRFSARGFGGRRGTSVAVVCCKKARIHRSFRDVSGTLYLSLPRRCRFRSAIARKPGMTAVSRREAEAHSGQREADLGKLAYRYAMAPCFLLRLVISRHTFNGWDNVCRRRDAIKYCVPCFPCISCISTASTGLTRSH